MLYASDQLLQNNESFLWTKQHHTKYTETPRPTPSVVRAYDARKPYFRQVMSVLCQSLCCLVVSIPTINISIKHRVFYVQFIVSQLERCQSLVSRLQFVFSCQQTVSSLFKAYETDVSFNYIDANKKEIKRNPTSDAL